MARRRPPTLQPPAKPRLDAELEERIEPAQLESGVERALIRRAGLAGVTARGVSVLESRLVDVDLSGARVLGLRLADVAVERGNLANLVAPEPALQRVEIAGARMTGVQWTRGRIADAVFR